MKKKQKDRSVRNNIVLPMALHTKAWTKSRRKEKGGSKNRQSEWMEERDW